MSDKKRPYKAPRVVGVGSFEELTQSARKWDNLVIFGMTGGAANLEAVS